jgi:hypothetical protein
VSFLHEIKSHADLARIPIFVCTLAPLSLDIVASYGVKRVYDKAFVDLSTIKIDIEKVLYGK